jgi:probable HAF family extracellular repeat protein
MVTGWFRNNAGFGSVRWTPNGQRFALGKLPGWPNSQATGINRTGDIVGLASSQDFLLQHAWIWTEAAGVVPLDDLGGGGSAAWAINDAGTVVGNAYATNGELHAVKWLNGGGPAIDLNPPNSSSQALAINEAGDIVGWAEQHGSAGHAFLWKHDGTMLDLGTLGGTSSQANAVNNYLVVVGSSDRLPPLEPVSFIWSELHGMRLLKLGVGASAYGVSNQRRSVGLQLERRGAATGTTRFQGVTEALPQLNPGGLKFAGPIAVNRCGTIVGYDTHPHPTGSNPVPAIWSKPTCD